MIQTYRVLLGGRTVARLFARGDYTWLEWQDGYWEDPRRPVLGLGFENRPRARVAAALRLPPWFSNLLPEGRLREWVALDAGVNERRELQLLVRLGLGLPGAVVVEPSDDVDPTWQPDRVEPPPSRSDYQGPLRFSLAGVALKFSLLGQHDRLTVPAADQEGDWIVKMPDAGFPGLPFNEHAMMSLAARCGIETPETRLYHRDELPPLPEAAWPAGQEVAYAVRRFDRDGQRRIHTEDLAQVRGFYPDDKYRGTYATVAALVYRGRDEASYLELVRRLFFSWAIGNGDLHLKNLSLIYRDPRLPVLAPAYDLVSTAAYLPDGAEDLALRLGRSRRLDAVTPAAFEHLARTIGAPVAATNQAVVDTAARLGEAWPEAAPLLDRLPRHQAWLGERVAAVCRQVVG